MVATLETSKDERTGPSGIAARLLACRRAATITEYALAAAVVVTASGAVNSPRFQAVKDESCSTKHEGCTTPTMPAEPIRPTVAQPARIEMPPSKSLPHDVEAAGARKHARRLPA